MTRFLIAGLGSVGRRHLRNLQALGEGDIVAVRSGRSTLPEEEVAAIPAERDLGTALRRFRPDAVIVATPTALHLETAIPAARAGCHLFIEKPIAHRTDGIDQLRAACQGSGSRVVVGFQYRFNPGLREVRRLLEADEIGRPVYAGAHWGEYLPDWHPWEDFRLSYAARADLGGGAILTLCHPFDYLRWLIGEVASVSATTARLGDFSLDVEDTAQISLVFSSGALGAIHLDYIQKPPAHRLEVVGSRGTVQWDNSDSAVRWWREGERGWASIPAPEGFERNTMFLDEMRHFVAVVRGETQPAVGFEDGARALELALGALGSAREARKSRTASGEGA
jgi:predicted dehydrogenase